MRCGFAGSQENDPQKEHPKAATEAMQRPAMISAQEHNFSNELGINVQLIVTGNPTPKPHPILTFRLLASQQPCDQSNGNKYSDHIHNLLVLYK